MSQQSPGGHGLEACKVMMVDDQEDIRLLLRLTLEPLGCRLGVASTGAEAIELARSFLPDVIILDVMMPGGIDGYQVCQFLRSDPETSRAYIILLSARGQKADIENGMRAGADYYMIKPFSPLELTDLIAGVRRRTT